MEYKVLGKSGLKVSSIGIGTVQFGLDYGFTKKKSQDEVDSILDLAKGLGVNFIDTAPAYGDSEEKIGRYISSCRDNFIIATKFEKISYDDIKDKGSIKKKVFSSVEKSLKKLGLTRLDALQLHQADEFLVSNGHFWGAVSGVKNEGMVGAFGISLYETTEAQALSRDYGGLIDFFQVPYNTFDRRFEKQKKALEEKNIGIIGRSAFLKGIISCEISEVPAELKDIIPFKEKLNEISRKAQLKPQETALLFMLSRGFTDTAIIGVNSTKELEENIKVLEKSYYIKDHLKELEALEVNEISLIDPRMWKSL